MSIRLQFRIWLLCSKSFFIDYLKFAFLLLLHHLLSFAFEIPWKRCIFKESPTFPSSAFKNHRPLLSGFVIGFYAKYASWSLLFLAKAAGGNSRATTIFNHIFCPICAFSLQTARNDSAIKVENSCIEFQLLCLALYARAECNFFESRNVASSSTVVNEPQLIEYERQTLDIIFRTANILTIFEAFRLPVRKCYQT